MRTLKLKSIDSRGNLNLQIVYTTTPLKILYMGQNLDQAEMVQAKHKNAEMLTTTYSKIPPMFIAQAWKQSDKTLAGFNEFIGRSCSNGLLGNEKMQVSCATMLKECIELRDKLKKIGINNPFLKELPTDSEAIPLGEWIDSDMEVGELDLGDLVLG